MSRAAGARPAVRGSGRTLRTDIQGLRALAIALVVAFHLWPDRLPGGFVGVTIAGRERRAHWVSAYAEAKPSELAMVVDSYGMCALAFDQRSAAAELHVGAGATLTLVALAEGAS